VARSSSSLTLPARGRHVARAARTAQQFSPHPMVMVSGRGEFRSRVVGSEHVVSKKGGELRGCGERKHMSDVLVGADDDDAPALALDAA